MENKNFNNNFFIAQSESKSCRADETLGETMARCMEQIGYDDLEEDKDIARELALIMAEVYRLSPNSFVKIDKTEHLASDVAEVFKMIERLHIESVIRKNDERTYAVKYRKAYLRTLLYNSVFEFSSAKIEDL